MSGVSQRLAMIFSALGQVEGGLRAWGCAVAAAGRDFGLGKAPSSRLELGALLACTVHDLHGGLVWGTEGMSSGHLLRCLKIYICACIFIFIYIYMYK